MGYWPLYAVFLALMVEGTLYLYAPNHRRTIVHVAPKPSLKPVPKITAAALAGALTIVGVWVAGLFDVVIPGEAAAGITTILSFVAGWFTP